MRQSLISVLLLSLLLAPVRGQTGPQITQSSVAGGGGVSTQGTLRVEGIIGQSSAGASSGGTFTLQGGFYAPGRGPSVLSVVRTSTSPATQNSSVGYAITFDEPVTGIDAADFQLTTTGLSGASVTNVTGSGATYDVTVNTGTPASSAAGTLRLDVVDDDTVVNAVGDLLGGTGAGNGNFNSGEVYTVEPFHTRVNDAQVSEASAGTTPLLFTVSLSASAPAGGISFNYSTAGGGATPATGGASCGDTTDYVTASGTAVIPAGSQVATIPVTVCADTDSPESNETLLLNISSASSGTIQDAQAVGTITQGTTPGTFIISELRTSGPGGSGDDFVEMYNNTNSPLTVAATDASAGYGLFKMGATCNDTPVLLATIPAGTIIPARGHYLAVGSAYSLANDGGTNAAAGDATLISDIGDDANVAVFTTTDVANLSTATRLDAVGFGTNTDSTNAAAAVDGPGQLVRKGVRADVLSAAGSNGVCDLLREGTNLPAVSGSTAQYTFFRSMGSASNGNPKDTGDNAADFTFVDTQGTFIAGVTQRLGAPGPENLSSPIRRDTSGIGLPLLDGAAASSVHPNRTRAFTSDPANNSTFGTLTIRRRVVNNTGGSVTRLRLRIVDMTTFPAPPGQADLRARTGVVEASIGPVNDAATCTASGAGSPPCNVTVQPTTLETPSNQPNGGGINSTLSAGTITLGTPLASGASLNVNFLLGIQQTGTFRFIIIIEALP
jgi:hypothetical protein